jgi:acetyltransferase-like isoleucine patch superfamily enzyme
MADAVNTPWKISNEILRRFLFPYIRLIFAINGIQWGKNWKILGVPIIQKHRLSSIRIGSGLGLRSTARSNPLGLTHPVILCTWQAGAVIEIGKNFAMTGGSLVAANRITIGNDVNIGANSTVTDTDFHPLTPIERREKPQSAETAAIVIEDDVFIGMNCIILKGVTIGQNSVIGAGSVVSRDVPPGVIVAGNPAKIIRSL